MILCVLVDVLRHFLWFHHVSCFIIAPSSLLSTFRLGIDLPTRSIFFGHGVRFFNTNNLWVDLVALKREFRRNDGALPLPVMKRIGEWMGMGGFFTGKCLVFGGKYMFLWGSYITLSTVQVFGKIMSCGVFMRRCSCFFVTRLL